MNWERLNHELDVLEVDENMEEHGRCLINTNLVCQECGGCNDDTDRKD